MRKRDASFIVAPNRDRNRSLAEKGRRLVVMLLPMLIASLLGVKARKTYLRDVATAAASSRADKS